MSRFEYLKTLESHLRLSLSRSEINDILRDYGEYFTEGENQGKGEWEIIAKLGDPKEVAKQIISESHKGQVKKSSALILERAAAVTKSITAAVGNYVRTSAGKITLILLVLLCAPLWVGACATLLCALLALFGGLIGLALVCACVVLSGIAAAVTASLFITVLPFTVILLLFVFSIGLMAGGVLALSLLIIAFKWGCNLVLQLCQWIKCYFISKAGAPVVDDTSNLIKQEGETKHA